MKGDTALKNAGVKVWLASYNEEAKPDQKDTESSDVPMTTG